MDDLCLILQSAVENFENFMNATPEKAKSNFARAAQFFCRFLCPCFSRLKLLSYTFNGENVDRVLVHLFSLPLIFTLHLIGGQEHFLFCHRRHKIFMLFFQQKNVSFFFISGSRSLSPFLSLSFAGLPPTGTFSFSLSFSCSIFQICAHDN